MRSYPYFKYDILKIHLLKFSYLFLRMHRIFFTLAAILSMIIQALCPGVVVDFIHITDLFLVG
jgi:hypothetical protein